MAIPKKAVIIGSGFAGLSVSSFLAKAGWQVTVIEKHCQAGGRARRLEANGFCFDMGPSWYWMPDVFERYFRQFGKSRSDFYELERLDPSYRIYWPGELWDIPASYDALKLLFEKYEPGAGAELDKVMEEAGYKYTTGMQKLVFKPGQSLLEFADADLIKGIFKLDVFISVKKHFSRHFKHPKIRQLLEFPVLFLGALAENTPALYSLMNYADIKGGTWFPRGGMYKIAEAMYQVALKEGVTFLFEHDAITINTRGGKAASITCKNKKAVNQIIEADVFVSNADYHFTETRLLQKESRSYSEKYWNSRVMAPGCLLYYVGINKKLPGIKHHSLFFDEPFEPHARDIYTSPSWPAKPLFYVSVTSITDPSQAPPGCENLFFLIPVATGLDGDDETLRQRYFSNIVERFEKRTGHTIREHIIYYKSFAGTDFMKEYNAFKGNAYGLANTLLQTAILKPSCRSRKVKNLFYTGQLTVPGPGIPPALISGEVVAREIVKHF